MRWCANAKFDEGDLPSLTTIPTILIADCRPPSREALKQAAARWLPHATLQRRHYEIERRDAVRRLV